MNRDMQFIYLAKDSHIQPTILRDAFGNILASKMPRIIPYFGLQWEAVCFYFDYFQCIFLFTNEE